MQMIDVLKDIKVTVKSLSALIIFSKCCFQFVDIKFFAGHAQENLLMDIPQRSADISTVFGRKEIQGSVVVFQRCLNGIHTQISKQFITVKTVFVGIENNRLVT